MEKQLREMGASFDWDYEVITCEPEYYKWTQWLFLELYKNGLAYRKEAPVNFCTSCNTVLANEQVIDGLCERCESQVIKKNLTQWFFKITDYADELLTGLDSLDWPEKTKIMQKNWIGKSEGGEIKFKTGLKGKDITAFTTRADTLFGVSFVVLAPEHPLVKEITTKEKLKAVEAYIEETTKLNEIERLSAAREKSGVFTGGYCVNPANNERVPVFIADYVLLSYGTGAVMGVPAHDSRDFIFAKKYNLPIKQVVTIDGGRAPKDGLTEAVTEYGALINSGEFDGQPSEEAIKNILTKLKNAGLGSFKTNYRLRDWLVSRQRYWGAPIPMIHCEKCGVVPVPEKDLPVLLPGNVDFTPDGKSPLLKCQSFMNVRCPECGSMAKRDPDTLDTFVCSSWYFLRYPDAKNKKAAFDKELINKMLPVDKYIGGAEHACMHLLYARFITKALRDAGRLNFDEPFKSLIHQGIILGSDGNKMSKSKGNFISPDEYIKKSGTDAFRLNLMFSYNYTEGGALNDENIKTMVKFLERIERTALRIKEQCAAAGLKDKAKESLAKENFGKDEKELNFARNRSIKKIREDLEVFSFNTAIARLYEFLNAVNKYEAAGKNPGLLSECVKDFIVLSAPLAPHFAEELWERLGYSYSVFNERYPVCDEKALVQDEIEIVIQINNKIRGKLIVENNCGDESLKAAVLADEKIKELLNGLTVKKIIIIPNKLVNIVV
jgi:leucyl-tRNA synthetase